MHNEQICKLSLQVMWKGGSDMFIQIKTQHIGIIAENARPSIQCRVMPCKTHPIYIPPIYPNISTREQQAVEPYSPMVPLATIDPSTIIHAKNTAPMIQKENTASQLWHVAFCCSQASVAIDWPWYCGLWRCE